MPKVIPEEVAQVRFKQYGFVGVNKADWSQDSNYPNLTVKFFEVESVRNSPGGVKDWYEQKYKKEKVKQPGYIVSVDILATELEPLPGVSTGV